MKAIIPAVFLAALLPFASLATAQDLGKLGALRPRNDPGD